MLATPGTLPSGPEWAFEVKFDGIRLLLALSQGRLRLQSRNDKDLTRSFPELAGLADALLASGHGAVLLDGELVSAIPGEVPSLGSIATRIHRQRPDARVVAATPVTYVVFDLLRLDGQDLTRLPYDERRAQLRELIQPSSRWCVADGYDDGSALWRATEEQGVEGVVAKRRSSTYQPGVRSRDWIKAVHRNTGEFVVGGWRLEPHRSRIGALVVAEPRDGELVCVGRVGSGMTQATSDALAPVLAGIRRPDPPFEVPPLIDPDGATLWCEVCLVVEVRFLGFTPEGLLRAPVIVRLRPDRTAADLLAAEELR